MIYKGRTVKEAISKAVRGRKSQSAVDFAACAAEARRFDFDLHSFLQRAEAVKRVHDRFVSTRHARNQSQAARDYWANVEQDAAIVDAFTPVFGTLRSLANSTDRGRFRPSGDGTQVTTILGFLEAAVQTSFKLNLIV